jgi:hypothetical protein
MRGINKLRLWVYNIFAFYIAVTTLIEKVSAFYLRVKKLVSRVSILYVATVLPVVQGIIAFYKTTRNIIKFLLLVFTLVWYVLRTVIILYRWLKCFVVTAHTCYVIVSFNLKITLALYIKMKWFLRKTRIRFTRIYNLVQHLFRVSENTSATVSNVLILYKNITVKIKNGSVLVITVIFILEQIFVFYGRTKFVVETISEVLERYAPLLEVIWMFYLHLRSAFIMVCYLLMKVGVFTVSTYPYFFTVVIYFNANPSSYRLKGCICKK